MLRNLTLAVIISSLLAGCTNIIHSIKDDPFQPDPSETTIGTDIDDSWLETMIGVNIKKAHPLLESAHINITAYNRVILLTGEVPNNDLRSLAGQTARDFRGVRQVHNELVAQGVSSFISRTNDTWITTKVKSKLIANDQIDGGNIKVVTEDGVIYLMGIVTRTSADRAAEIASTTRGARRVVKAFEYLD